VGLAPRLRGRADPRSLPASSERQSGRCDAVHLRGRRPGRENRRDHGRRLRAERRASPLRAPPRPSGTLRPGNGAWLESVDVEAAPRLGESPRNAWVVFVVDASRSEGAEGIAAELEVVRGYLKNLPDARVELVAFNRRARRGF